MTRPRGPGGGPRPGPATPARGREGRVRFLVTRSAWDMGEDTRGDVYDDLDASVRPDLRYHYSSALCAHRWLDVCADPAYGHHALIARVRRAMPAVLAAIGADRRRTAAVALTSLGCGDGALDEALLRAVDARTRVHSYCAVDSSFALLSRAATRFAGVTRWRSRFPVTALCGDFARLRADWMEPVGREVARVFSLTGLTLGNHRESTLLEEIRRAMRADDYLLLDARLHSRGPSALVADLPAGARARMLRNYDLPSVRRFIFGPVEMATLATAADVAFGYEVSRRVSVVPGAMNVIMYCAGLASTARFSGRRIRRKRLDLAVTTLYHLPDLLDWFTAAGFMPLWSSRDDGIAVLLLRPGGRR
jgi:hypothetical protein